MATPAVSATPPLSAAPLPAGAGSGSASARFGDAPTSAFASLLDQLGQSPATPATTDAPDPTKADAVAVGASAPELAKPLKPILVQPTPPDTIPPVPTLHDTATPSAAITQPSDAAAGKETKSSDKKARSGTVLEAESLPLVPIADPGVPAQPPVPVAINPLPVANPTAPTPTPATSAGSPSSDATSSVTSSLPAATAAPTTQSIAVPATLADTSKPSRMADQASASTQAGLSVVKTDEADDRGSGEPEPPQAAVNHVAATLSATALPVVPPQPASVPPAAPSAPPRTSAPASIGPTETATTAKSTGSFDLATGLSQSPAASPADNQAVPPTLVPPQTIPAPALSTRPLQAEPPPPSPAAQVARAVAEPVKVVLTNPIQAGATTSHVTTIQITPAELGRVDIRIERTNDGPAKIQLVAERSETLSRLVNEQSHLQQALDHAGIPQNSRTLEFSLAPAAPDSSAFSTSMSGNNTSNDGTSSNGSSRQNNNYYSRSSADADDTQIAPLTRSRFVRTGIDITA